MLVRKTWFGLVVLVLTHWAAGAAFAAVFSPMNASGIALQAGTAWLIAASAASWVVCRGFWLPTVVAWLTLWGLVIGALYAIAAPMGQASVLGVLHSNVVGIVLSGAAALLGASVGSWRRTRLAPQQAAT